MKSQNTNNIGIIGVGKLGLPYALALEQCDYTVYASSYKQDYVDQLQNKIVDTEEPMVKELLSTSKNIEFTVDNHRVIENCDFIYVMVATPSLPAGNYDIDAVIQVARDFISFPGNVRDKILVIGSTVNPGDSQQIQEMLDQCGVNVVYCPTFVAQGTVIKDIYNSIGLLIGTNNQTAASQCVKVFEKIINPESKLSVVNHTTAEVLKLALNCYTILRITYFNKIGEILAACGQGDDIEKANKTLNELDRRKGSLQFGFGFGGPCYPRDNKSLGHFANNLNIDYSIGYLVDQYNLNHNNFLFSWLNEQNTQNRPIYFHYLTYKQGTTIDVESRQFELCCKFLEHNHIVYVNPDQFLPQTMKKYLEENYPEKVFFKDKQTLIDQNIDFFEVPL